LSVAFLAATAVGGGSLGADLADLAKIEATLAGEECVGAIGLVIFDAETGMDEVTVSSWSSSDSTMRRFLRWYVGSPLRFWMLLAWL
jgi:hypothetical protein